MSIRLGPHEAAATRELGCQGEVISAFQPGLQAVVGSYVLTAGYVPAPVTFRFKKISRCELPHDATLGADEYEVPEPGAHSSAHDQVSPSFAVYPCLTFCVELS